MNVRDKVLSGFDSYFPPAKKQYFSQLPIPVCTENPSLETRMVELPDWASDIGAESKSGLLVPLCCMTNPAEAGWESVDWWYAAFLLMTCNAERLH